MNNPFHNLLTHRTKSFNDLRSYTPPTPTALLQATPNTLDILIFSPHPDDECIIGGLALRLQQENNYTVGNVAVTLGSNEARQLERLQELKNACAHLNFHLIETAPHGLSNINLKNRNAPNPTRWQEAVTTIANLLTQYQPKIILFPHADDSNGTHVGTHWLVQDALALMPNTFTTLCIETEYWHPMKQPNLLLELSTNHVAHLMQALSYHTGEIARNPYHLRLPDWMSDTVRRAEIVGGQGSTAPEFNFGIMYGVKKWEQGKLTPVTTHNKIISSAENISAALLNSYLAPAIK